MTTAWRIVKERHAKSAFDGEGARKYGGRWNSPGTAVVYASETRALALLEVLVRIRSVAALGGYVLIPARFEESLVSAVEPEALPEDWRENPPPPSTQRIGDDWVASESSPVLKVPSVIVPDEFNYLINLAHPEFARIALGESRGLSLDPRLVR